MLTGKNLIRATREYEKENILQSWFHLLSTIALFALVITLALMPLHWAIRSMGSVLGGLFIVRLFVIYHDHLHRTILTNSFLGKILMQVWGFIVLAPARTWSSSHNQHHAHNSKLRDESPGAFAVMTAEKYLSSTLLQRIAYRISRHPLTLLFGYFTVFMGSLCIGPMIFGSNKHYHGAVAIIAHALLYVLVISMLGWTAAFFGLFLPFGIAFALGSYLFYAQHNFPEVELFATGDGWTYEGAALRASSYLDTGAIMSYFTGNIGYHHIHHLNPKIPFYRLPEAFRAIPELSNPIRTSLRPSDIIKCLRLDVWEEKQRRLVPVSSIARWAGIYRQFLRIVKSFLSYYLRCSPPNKVLPLQKV